MLARIIYAAGTSDAVKFNMYTPVMYGPGFGG